MITACSSFKTNKFYLTLAWMSGNNFCFNQKRQKKKRRSSNSRSYKILFPAFSLVTYFTLQPLTWGWSFSGFFPLHSGNLFSQILQWLNIYRTFIHLFNLFKIEQQVQKLLGQGLRDLISRQMDGEKHILNRIKYVQNCKKPCDKLQCFDEEG